MKRCPNALAKQSIVLESVRLYGGYKQGITPQGKGMRAETALYSEAMATLEQLEAEAERWYMDEMEDRRKKRGNRRN